MFPAQPLQNNVPCPHCGLPPDKNNFQPQDLMLYNHLKSLGVPQERTEITPNQAYPQYAMEDTKNKYDIGLPRGGEGGAGGGGRGVAPEILSPKSASTAPPSLQAQIKELEDQQRTLMQMGPMVPQLIKLGVTPQQMKGMNPAEAYQFIKARSPAGMGQRDVEGERAVMNAIDQIRAQRGILSNKLLGGNE